MSIPLGHAQSTKPGKRRAERNRRRRGGRHIQGRFGRLAKCPSAMSALTSPKTQPLAKIDWDYVEFYTGNAKQAAHYYCSAFGFEQIAYAGPETGVKDHASYLLAQNSLRFVLTSSLLPDDAIARHVALHGDGVKDIAILVEVADEHEGAAVA